MGWVVAGWRLVRTRETPGLDIYNFLLYPSIKLKYCEKGDVSWVSLPLI